MVSGAPQSRFWQVIPLLGLLSSATWAQSFVVSPGRIPANAGYTEGVEFADVDGDGDLDAAVAEGGDGGNDQNNLWINRGFESGGAIGYFTDRTAAHFPPVLDCSRDVDFVDLDGDGDMDLHVSNTSAHGGNQSSRWWINMGGTQGGTQGFFLDRTSSHFAFIAVNNGTTHHSSLPTSAALASGGFIDWTADSVFGDLDNDGDPDLFHTSYGGNSGGAAPSRIFLNTGGVFEEFNPSGVQLIGSAIADFTPALWALGQQKDETQDTTGFYSDIADSPMGVELGDLDGDLDVDVLQGALHLQVPRVFRNRLSETGAFVAFQDVTYATGVHLMVDNSGNYEQELGDFDNDGDLDLYGVNWPSLGDITARNDGAGVFSSPLVPPASSDTDFDADFIDYDNDGRLDVFVACFAGQDRLYRNNGAPSWNFTNVTSVALPVTAGVSLSGDSCDVDSDGDYDFLVTNGLNQPETFLENVSSVPDTSAPRIVALEEAPDRIPGAAATVVRASVYDNSSWDLVRLNETTLEYSTSGFVTFNVAAMRHSGGQIFRGEIPGSLSGSITYRVRAIDEHGNVGVSVVKGYIAGSPVAVNYCTAGTSSHGCAATMGASGLPSVSAASGFTLTTANVEGQRSGVIFYGISGRVAYNWGPGNSSLLCVKSPAQRLSMSVSGGTAGACDGVFSTDWLVFLSTQPGALGQPFAPGVVVDAQCWYRDPAAAGTTNLSDGIEFTTQP